jgi:hypothetical protein
MAIIIQQLENVINILESTRPAGEQIINSLAVDCVAKVQHKDPYSDQLNIMDSDGKPTQVIKFDGTVQVQDIGDVAGVFVGTIDDFCNKLNDEYFINTINEFKSNLQTLISEADDLVKTFSYLDAGDPTNRRVELIVYSSATLGITVRETFTYAGGAGDYYVQDITLS